MSSKAKLHARRRAARFGDLDALLVEALKQQKRGDGAVKRLKGVNMEVHQRYANPLNWREAGVVMVLYIDDHTGEQQTVGLFQHLIHNTGARKLVRVNCADTAQGITQEVYHDPFLVRGKVDPCPPTPKSADPLAQLAIRDYLARQRAQQSLSEFLGGDIRAKVDAQGLLNELKTMGVEKLR